MWSRIMDYFVDKISSFSAKMKGESLNFSGSSYLMNVNSNSLFQHMNAVDLYSGLVANDVIEGKISNQVVQLKQPLGYLTGTCNYSFSIRNAEKPFLRPINKSVINNFSNFSESHLIWNDSLLYHLVGGVRDQLTEMNSSLNSKSDTQSLAETDKSPATIKCELPNKYAVPSSLTLNKELASRITKEMNKRSKKRRQRQKKSQHMFNNSSEETSSLTWVCMVSDNAEFGSTVALNVTLNILSSFVVPTNSASGDDSEWEFCQVNSSCQKISTSPCSWSPNCATSFLSSFIVPVDNSTDDESDWDSCDTEIFAETSEFEFAGLFVTSFCASQSPHHVNEDDEMVKLRIHLQDVNKTWNKSSKGLQKKTKLPSKVSFAPDEVLIKVFPVEIYDRKGEWETYATERLRFKRRIEELEKILSPCFHPDHRAKVLKKLSEAML